MNEPTNFSQVLKSAANSASETPQPPGQAENTNTTTATPPTPEQTQTLDQQGAATKLLNDAHVDPESSEGFDHHSDAFRAATGLDLMPTAGTSPTFDVRVAESNASRGEGISRGQQVSYSDSSGGTITGGQYTKSDGTYFKTTDGDTYRVQMENNSYTLEPTTPGAQPIQADKMTLLTNTFGSHLNDSRSDFANKDVASTPQVAPASEAASVATITAKTTSSDVPHAQTTVSETVPTPSIQTDASATSSAAHSQTAVNDVITAPRAQAAANEAVSTPNSHPTEASTSQATAPEVSAIAHVQQTSSDAASVIRSQTAASDVVQTPRPQTAASDVVQTPRPQAAASDVVQTPLAQAAGAQAAVSEVLQTPRSQPTVSEVVQTPRSQPTVSEVVQAPRPQPAASEMVPAPHPQAVVSDALSGSHAQAVVSDALAGSHVQAAQSGTDAGLVNAIVPAGIHSQLSDAAQTQPAAHASTSEISSIVVAQTQSDTRTASAVSAQNPAQLVALTAGLIEKAAPAALSGQASVLVPGSQPLDGGPAAVKVTNPLQSFNPTELGKAPDGKQLQLSDSPRIGVTGVDAVQATHQAGIKDGADLTGTTTTALRTLINGFDLNDSQNRNLASEIFRQFQLAKDGLADPHSRNLQELARGMDAGRLERLQSFIFPDGTGRPNEAALTRLGAVLSLGQEKVTVSSDRDNLSTGVGVHVDRLVDFLKGRDLGTESSLGTHTLLPDIAKVIGDTNRSLALDGKEQISLSNLIARSIDSARPGEKSLDIRNSLDHTDKQDPLSFTARFTPMQEQAVRVILDRLDASRRETDKTGVKSADERPNQESLITHAIQLPSDSKVRQEQDKDHAVELQPVLKEPLKIEPTQKSKEEEEDRLKHDHRRELDEKARQAALLAAVAERQLKEQNEKEQKEQREKEQKERAVQARKDEDARRRRYIIRERDTLESIAAKELKDQNLSMLIHQINRAVIPSREVDGHTVVDLRVGMGIWLPSIAEIREFRDSHSNTGSSGAHSTSAEQELEARFGKGWSADGSATKSSGVKSGIVPADPAAAQARRGNIEKMLGPIVKPTDGKLRYVVRLGDTLKSIAMKHPGVQDLAMWKLIATLNDLTVELDDKGSPLAKLARGTALIIPDQRQIDAYRESAGLKPPRLDRGLKLCASCHCPNPVGASLCTACNQIFAQPIVTEVSAHRSASTVVREQILEKPKAPDVMDVQPVSAARQTIVNDEGNQVSLRQLDEDSRIAQSQPTDSSDAILVSAVEVRRGSKWEPAVAYELHQLYALRYEFSPNGERRSVRIEVPFEAGLALSNNDLQSNWKNYRDRYSAEVITLGR